MPTGKQMTTRLVGLVLALVIGAILIGNVMPVGINEVEQDDTINLTQDEGVNTVVVSNKLESNVTASSAGTSATIELTDVESGNTVSNTVNVGNSKTFSIAGESVNVTVNSVTAGSPNTTDATYEVPPDYGWNDSSKSLWSLIPVFLILGALVLLAGIVMKQM